jgi:4-hydroxy-4-methyl-2-oxoglutarate aldolase
MEPTKSTFASRLESAYSGAIYDVLREMGFADQTLPQSLRPLDPTRKLAGPVFTASGRIAEIDEDESLVRWCEMLAEAPFDHVVVCQPNDSTLAHMGELSSETLKFRGIRGYVVDGGCRDSDFVMKIGFPVFCRYQTPGDIVGKWTVEALGESIKIGSLTIQNGDYIMGDRDGLVLIPKERVQECVERVEEVMSTENLVRKAILAGVNPKEAYLKYGRF